MDDGSGLHQCLVSDIAISFLLHCTFNLIDSMCDENSWPSSVCLDRNDDGVLFFFFFFPEELSL